ncbi:MAG: ABC transporter permease [Alphaproteobacteria bacterium]|nr:ABC transporter permease [Alphaproteobacteria bacterium]MCY4498714.1 ABC transporter permease [Rhodospirillaceae bacterium]
MTDTTADIHVRPEFVVERLEAAQDVDVERRLSLFERISNINAVRKFTILLGLVALWEGYTRIGDVEPLLFPSFSASAAVLWETLLSGLMLEKVWITVYVLVLGYAAGLFLAAALLVFAVMTRVGSDFLSTMTAMFQPLPAISLLPLAMLWFGLGVPSLVFVTIHSVLWAVALSTHTGFMSVSETLRMVGRNYGLRGIPYVFTILVPAAFASILTGMKVGWAFAWRTLIGAELVFGAASGEGGLGWMIFERGDNLETPYVFAALFTVIVIGLIVENLIFRNIEIGTVQKWGMQR